MSAVLITHRRPFTRTAFALAAAVLLVLAVGQAMHGGGWWPLALTVLAPDLTLLAGLGPDLAKGQLHPRAVPAYNALHRVWAPALLVAAAAMGLLGAAWLVAGLTWGFHVALDRAVGYGLRTPEGFQRG